MSLNLFVMTCMSVDHPGLLRSEVDRVTALQPNRPRFAIYLAV